MQVLLGKAQLYLTDGLYLLSLKAKRDIQDSDLGLSQF
jgi:hypothetical protein